MLHLKLTQEGTQAMNNTSYAFQDPFTTSFLSPTPQPQEPTRKSMTTTDRPQENNCAGAPLSGSSRPVCTVTTVTFCNPHQRIPEPSAPFPSPQAQSRNLTVIPSSEHPFPITLDHSRPDRAQPDRLYLSLVSSSSPSLASSHTLPLPLSRSLHLTPLVLRLRQPYTTQPSLHTSFLYIHTITDYNLSRYVSLSARSISSRTLVSSPSV